jgi:hypothetical protein
MKIGESRMRPTVNPMPLPKLFDASLATMIHMMKLTNGMKNRISHHPGRPTILNST